MIARSLCQQKGDSTMTVYVVQEVQGRDIIGAMKYGELVSLLPPGNQIVLSAQPVVRSLNRSLKDFSDDDYLLCMGDPTAIGIATAIAARHNRGRVKFLKWDKREFTYYPIEVDVSGAEV
jgi:hypothetical protein